MVKVLQVSFLSTPPLQPLKSGVEGPGKKENQKPHELKIEHVLNEWELWILGAFWRLGLALWEGTLQESCGIG